MSGVPDILQDIAAARSARVVRDGAAQGLKLPAERAAPSAAFHGPSTAGVEVLIAEIKRRSPSKGDIAAIPEPEALARRYRNAGFRRVSVLTEEARFGGSLADLMAVKEACPDLAVLRKDFLLSVEDVEVSHRAGADAILLIAALLDAPMIEAMHRRAGELGLASLVEVHGADDVAKVRPLRPPLVGINSRDLRKFRIDPLKPLETRSLLDWPCDVVYESGIAGPDDVLFVRGAGFSGFLVGESVARDPELAPRLVKAWSDEETAAFRYGAWDRLYRRHRDGAPLVKICGITNRDDAETAVDAGADMLGFVMAESPRRTDAAFIRSCADLPVLKAAVVVLGRDEDLPPELAELVVEGAVDFIQFHGDETAGTVRSWPSYKAIRMRRAADAEALDSAGSPGVLVDAFSEGARGGTGRRLAPELLDAAAEHRRPWIAGGLNPDNAADIVARWKPGLVDVSSGVESAPGRKDPEALRRFVRRAKGAKT